MGGRGRFKKMNNASERIITGHSLYTTSCHSRYALDSVHDRPNQGFANLSKLKWLTIFYFQTPVIMITKVPTDVICSPLNTVFPTEI
jgi:hypothetical protein